MDAVMEQETLLMEGSRCLYQGDYAGAIALQHQCLEQDPENAGHYWRLGILYCLIGDEAAAQETWFSVLSQTAINVHRALSVSGSNDGNPLRCLHRPGHIPSLLLECLALGQH